MIKRASAFVFLLAVSLIWQGQALPQTASPEALAAAKELMAVSKMTDQLRQILPTVTQQVRTMIVSANPRAAKDFDAYAAAMLTTMETRLQAFVDEGAKIYARHFTVEELRQVTDFFRTPTGEKFIREQPELMKESMVLGQQWGQAVGQEVYKQMVDELRKRGHNI